MASQWHLPEYVSYTIKKQKARKGYSIDNKSSNRMDDFELILQNGINFGKGGERPNQDGKVKTKAKKKKYITGAHGSGSAMQKAKYRKERANRKHR